jgi:hypothetical protein
MDQIELYVQQQDMSSIFSYCGITDNPFLPDRKAMIQQASFTVPSMKKQACGYRGGHTTSTRSKDNSIPGESINSTISPEKRSPSPPSETQIVRILHQRRQLCSWLHADQI